MAHCLAVLLTLFIQSTSVGAANSPSKTAPAPLGMEIGRSTCLEAAERLNATPEFSAKENAFRVVARAPAALYAGASQIEAWCTAVDAPVLLMTLKLSKGGMGNPASIEAYDNLSSKYKRVAGAQPPRVGNGYARFVHVDTVIELTAPHLSFEFQIKYMTQGVFDRWKSAEVQRQQVEAKARRDNL